MIKTDEVTLISTPVFDVTKKTFNDVGFNPVGIKCNDWVMIVAYDSLSKNPVCAFVKQTRWGSECDTIEFPCGTVEDGEDTFTAATREFKEETGIDLNYINNKNIKHRRFNPNPAYFNNSMTIYFIHVPDLINRFQNRSNQNLDEHEDCKVFIDRLYNQSEELMKHYGGAVAFMYTDTITKEN